MADLEITVPSDTPLFTQRVTLSGQEYVLEFDWSDREGRWFLSILDVNEQPLATGIKLVSNWPILNNRTNAALPPGTLYIFDPLEGDAPGFQDLGRTMGLIYRV